jgi:FAD/FMN-containing dehydrogenase
MSGARAHRPIDCCNCYLLSSNARHSYMPVIRVRRFFCHVFHQDYVVKKGFDPMEVEHEMWCILDQRHAEYPAEHNVGHLYYAKPSLVNHYRSLDPNNSFNPGIGHTSKLAHWK